ncbi:hypothetical protein GMOD_00008120 [Pyrenophora seminiperda CCB06]|uniref:Uncharacterized protein n=1 Tax=Pyrenophora seminiperda CCB06 TaxID=1302712 RepID=A0A3M7MGD5_9PLEO|nr:hypothetical protein GMOD_00008120 [Pyrenophora seminiperda CCB06]
MPLINSEPRSKCHEVNDGTELELNLISRSDETSSDKLTDNYNTAGVPVVNSTNGTSFDYLLVEPDYGLLLLSQLPESDTSRLGSNAGPIDLPTLIHRHYRAFQFLESLPNHDWTWKKATIEVITVRRAFPAIKEAEDSLLAMTAWFHFLCNSDDDVEQMDSPRRVLTLDRIIEALRTISLDPLCLMEHIKPARGYTDILKRKNMRLHRKVSFTTHDMTAAFPDSVGQTQMIGDDFTQSDHGKVLALASSFIRQCQVVLPHQSLPKVFAEVINMLEALKEESVYRETTFLPSLGDYLRLRLGPIGISPFFAILANALVGIETQESKAGNNSDEKYSHSHDNGGPTTGRLEISSF